MQFPRVKKRGIKNASAEKTLSRTLLICPLRRVVSPMLYLDDKKSERKNREKQKEKSSLFHLFESIKR